MNYKGCHTIGRTRLYRLSIIEYEKNNPLQEGEEVKVLQSAAQLPEDAESLGTVAVKETGFVAGLRR